MKKTIKLLLTTALFAGIFTSASAQRRTGENAAVIRRTVPTFGAPSQAATNVRENAQRSAPVRTFSPRSSATNSSPINNSRPSRVVAPQSNPSATASRPSRPSNPLMPANNVATSGPVRTFTPQRTNPQSSVSTRTPQRRIVTSNNDITQNQIARRNMDYNRYNNSNYNYHRNNSYGSRYTRQPVFMYGQRYSYRPRNSVSVYYGSVPYYYTDGYYYGYYNGYYQPVFPPFGLRISTLPYGYSRISIGSNPFYYYNGIYYREYNDNSYEVVDAPMGATVNKLPKGAKSVKVNGEKLYELNGTYYKADRNEKGKDVYVVVGKNGEINNAINDDSADVTSLEEGQIISTLPEGSKLITINGEQFYQSPEGTVFSQQVNDGQIEYKVVGK